jgi:hypothetical protein
MRCDLETNGFGVDELLESSNAEFTASDFDKRTNHAANHLPQKVRRSYPKQQQLGVNPKLEVLDDNDA